MIRSFSTALRQRHVRVKQALGQREMKARIWLEVAQRQVNGSEMLTG